MPSSAAPAPASPPSPILAERIFQVATPNCFATISSASLCGISTFFAASTSRMAFAIALASLYVRI
jgi:hypothetical protein